MMKLSLQQITPLYFRAITMTLGALSLLAYVRWAEGSVWPTRRDWRTLALLMLPNILAWHTLSIFGVQELASGRAAVLGFTMPVFTVVLGSLFFGQAITRRTLVAATLALASVVLLLWHEASNLSGRPAGVLWMILAAISWALGTLWMRRANTQASPLRITVWMLLLCCPILWTAAAALEPVPALASFTSVMWASLAWGAWINFGLSQVLWFGLARSLPPSTSTMSILAVPVLGTLFATVVVGEVPVWQDWVALMMVAVAIATVLTPARTRPAAS
jgi:drug/metabolite transporter (DMT)-like permease